MSQKKKILFVSNHSKLKTGFGRNAKAVLKHLYKTGKYHLIEYAAGIQWDNPELKLMPWKCFGTLPNSNQELQQLNQDPHKARMANYGEYNLDKIIKQEKPDIIFMVEDPWGILYLVDKPYFNKINENTVFWTTLDSLPLYPELVDKASKIKNLWPWASFATESLHEKGFIHALTVPGTFDTDQFYPLDSLRLKQIKKEHGLENDFIIGFVFRNQLRKEVHKLIEGFKIFLDQNPEVKNAKLLLHTSLAEGWDIMKLCEEYKVDINLVLTTYIDEKTREYFVKPICKGDIRNPKNGNPLNTISVTNGVSEEQLNEICNIFSVVVHPITSGGLEIPIYEQKLAEKITLVTNYSCGKDAVCDGSGGIPLDFQYYREFGTQFLKSTTSASSIAKNLKKVYNMKDDKKRSLEKQARQYALNHVGTDKIGKQLEKFIDSKDFINHENFSFEKTLNNSGYTPKNINETSDEEFILDLYRSVFNVSDRPDEQGFNHWMQRLANKEPREQILHIFKQLAAEENQKNKKQDIKDFLLKNDKKNFFFVLKESLGDNILALSLLKSIKKQYPNHNLNIVTDPKYFEVYQGDKYVDHLVPYHPMFEQEMAIIGAGQKEEDCIGDVYCLPAVATQKCLNYLSNNNPEI